MTAESMSAVGLASFLPACLGALPCTASKMAAPQQPQAPEPEKQPEPQPKKVEQVKPVTPQQGDEDLFQRSGAPVDQYDTPSFLRRRRDS